MPALSLPLAAGCLIRVGAASQPLRVQRLLADGRVMVAGMPPLRAASCTVLATAEEVAAEDLRAKRRADARAEALHTEIRAMLAQLRAIDRSAR